MISYNTTVSNQNITVKEIYMKFRFKRFIIPFACVSLLMCSSLYGDSFLEDAEKPSPLKNSESPAHVLQKTFRDIYDLYRDSVVFISTEKTVKTRYSNPFMDDPFFKRFFGEVPNREQTRKLKGLGTGFIISKDGYICTNYHVIENIDSVTVKVNDKEYSAKVVGSDPLIDIALLKISGNGNFKPVYMGNSDDVRIGDLAIAIGNPFGLDKTYTFGIISATGRQQLDDMGNSHIQTDASINQGNSGGPLINIDGEVIGVNRAIYSRSGGNIGIGFALPINMAKKTLVELKKYGKVKRGFIGVQISPLTDEFAKELGLKKAEGALIGSVLENGPAQKAGLKEKDVIIRINDKQIKNYQELIKKVSRTKIGKTLKVTVWRDKKKLNLWVTVKERPSRKK